MSHPSRPILGTLTLLPFLAAAAQAEAVSIPFESVAGLIVVQARVNQGPPAAFIVDTGANVSVLSDRYVRERRLPLRSRRVQLSGIGSPRSQSAVTLDLEAIQVGPLVAHRQAAIVQDLKTFETILNRPLAGVLGYTFLKQYRVTIDYNQQSLLLEQTGTPAENE
ncbi:retropepsin-like aspartic protease [Gloeobacter kilaueensis]|uniref:Peptidase A2 domain-containing protein n=1 Tax=Gloeobacter kilaueensis (strain ATCC BAA-2537 / CCAP 1431/1 / ULC 316 / JS1) TaxID=1183438 RepID=U5QGB6_GLOK1|nr:retropepsin-like aspartic protease [Gloeobacter kilaueensis]AGY56679.1 hypothetical protein GKIL_0433 [Gloeobacter kilaueensis JS1]